MSLIEENRSSFHHTECRTGSTIHVLPYIWLSTLFLPIAQGCRAHRPKPTELLDFDVFGSGAL